MTDSLRQTGGGKFTSPISVIVKPVYKALLSVDKNKIKALAIGIPTNATCLTKDGTSTGKALVVAKIDFHVCGNATVLESSLASWDKEITNGVLTKGGAFKPHEDLQTLSVLISLSSPEAFGGGGTAFWDARVADLKADMALDSSARWHRATGGAPPSLVLKPPAGTALLFGGDVTHAGVAVGSGTRCVFVASFSAAEEL